MSTSDTERARLIANLEVATGQVVSPNDGATRTEADFVAHIQQTVKRDPAAGWIFITDQLNIHQSESLVRWVAPSTNLGKRRSSLLDRCLSFVPNSGCASDCF